MHILGPEYLGVISNPNRRGQFQQSKAVLWDNVRVAEVQLERSVMRRLAQALSRCLRCNTCASMLRPTTPQLPLPEFVLKLRGKLREEGKFRVVNKNPKMPQTKDTVKLIHGRMSQSVFKKKKR